MAYHGTHKLYDQLVKYPQEVIPLMDFVISEVYFRQFEDLNEEQARLKVRLAIARCSPFI